MSLLLALDVGNSNTKLGLFDGEALTQSRRVETQVCANRESLARWIAGLSLPWTSIQAVALCSVVPTATAAWSSELSDRGLPPVIISGTTPTAMKNAYHDPAQLGADRLVAALAAWWIYGKPGSVIAINLGTATTVDAVSSQGVFCGGAIAPGVSTSLQGLLASAAQLTSPPLMPVDSTLGLDTPSALQAGAYWGAIGQVKELVSHAIAELGESPAIVVTGGFSSLIGPALPGVKAIDLDLTLKGIRLAWEQSRFTP